MSDDGIQRSAGGRFAAKIEELLEREPLGLDPKEHRAAVAKLLEVLGELSFFELLGVGHGARAEEIHAAYLAVARKVHPVHAETLGISGGAAALEILFDRVTEAYRTLSDPDRYQRYLEKNPDAGWSATYPSGEARAAEVAKAADRQFAAACRFATDGRYHDAIRTLEQALLIEERPEFLLLLASCEAQNPNWRGRAIANYRRAIELDPKSTEAYLALAGLYEEGGRTVPALRLVDRALLLEPENETARGLRDRLRPEERSEGSGGFFSRLLGREPDAGS